MLAALLVLSCNDDPKDSGGGDSLAPDDSGQADGAVAYVLIEPGGALLTPDQPSATLTAQAYDADDNPVDADIVWSNDDPDVQLDDGVVTALSQVGSAQVFASADGIDSAPAFILIAEPSEEPTLLSDAAVVDGFQVDDPESWGLGWQYGITVEGLDAPEPGSLVLASESLPIMGRLVEANGDDWTLELIGPDEAFTAFAVNEEMPLENIQPTLDPDLQGTHELVRDGQDWVIQPIDGADRGFGPYECEAEFSGAQISLGQMKTTLNHDLSFQFDWSSSDGFQRMLVLGSLELKGEVTVSASSAVEGELKCKADVVKIPIPVAGPISAVVRPQIELGDGLDFGGKLQVLDMSAKLEASAGGAFKAGLDCSGAECDWLADFNPTASAAFSTDGMNLAEDFQFEANVTKFNYAALQMAIWAGPIELWSVGLEETKAGVKEEWKLSPNLVQATNKSFASSEVLNIYVNFSAPIFAEAQQTLNGITGILKITLPSFSFTYEPYTLARSPRADPSLEKPFRVDKTAVVEGDPITVDLDLDPNTNHWLTIDNVDSVALYTLRDLTLTEVARTTAGENQTAFSFTWTPTEDDANDPPDLVAFVEPEFWPAFSLVEIEVGTHTWGCTPSYTAQIVARVGQGGLTAIAGSTGSVNDDGVVSFIGSDADGETLFLANSGLQKPAFQGGGRSYGGGGALNNSQQAIVRERVSSNSLVRRWEADGSHTILGRSYEGDFDSPVFWMDINNAGRAVYPALTGGATATTLFTATADGDASVIATFSGTVFARPSLSDDGTAVYRDDQDRLVLNQLGSIVTMPDTGVERHPGISALGNQVAWIKGDAVYTARPADNYTPVTVIQADSAWTAFDGDSRVGAAWVQDGCGSGKSPTLVVFVGTHDGASGVHVATLQDGGLVGIQTVLTEGQDVDGVTMNSFKLFDPISANGTIAVRAETSGGTAMVRLTPAW